MLAASVALPACSRGDDEPSFGDLVSDLEGEQLSQGEVARRRELAQFLCSLDRPVLEAMWRKLSEQQLEFQDVVFGVECRGRLPEYAAATGRFGSDDGG